MSNYRRWFVPGGTYFFTVVTYNRIPILTLEIARPILRSAFLTVKRDHPFEQLAIVLLPDHFHSLWILPPGDKGYGTRLKRIKEEFTKEYRRVGGQEGTTTESQQYRGERGVWQPRFWEHVIEDEDDLEAHLDYIHWNPVKHQLVTDVRDWPWSTFHKYEQSGHYGPGWGCTEPTTYQHLDAFGEPT